MLERAAATDAAKAKPSVWRTVMLVVVSAALLFFLTLIPRTVEVFIVATLVAYGVNPIVRRLVRRVPRPIAIVLVYAGLVVLMLVASMIIIPDTVNQLQTFFSNGAAYIASGRDVLGHVQSYLTGKFGTKVLPPQLQDIEGRVATEAATLVNLIVAGAGNLVLGIANVVIISITGVVLSYFFLSHSTEIRESFYSLFPENAQDKARLFAFEAGRAVGGFIFGQLVLSTFSGVATGLLLFAFGSDYALLLGVVTGLLYAVPYLGIFIALVLGAMLGALQSWQMVLITLAVIFIVTRVADLFLVPKVMGDTVGISPMAIIFAVFAGGELFGVWGLVLAIPAAAIFKVAWRLWLHPWLTGKPAVTISTE